MVDLRLLMRHTDRVHWSVEPMRLDTPVAVLINVLSVAAAVYWIIDLVRRRRRGEVVPWLAWPFAVVFLPVGGIYVPLGQAILWWGFHGSTRRSTSVRSTEKR